jgi:hypothetical protein
MTDHFDLITENLQMTSNPARTLITSHTKIFFKQIFSENLICKYISIITITSNITTDHPPSLILHQDADTSSSL